jgi:hypothetical protein
MKAWASFYVKGRTADKESAERFQAAPSMMDQQFIVVFAGTLVDWLLPGDRSIVPALQISA